MTWLANVEAFLAVAVAGVSAVLAGVSGISYRRLHNPRAALVGFGFLTFTGKGGYLFYAAYGSRGTEPWITIVALFDLLILLLLYLSIRIR